MASSRGVPPGAGRGRGKTVTEPPSALHHRYTPVRGIRSEPKTPGSKGQWWTAEGFAKYTAAYFEALSAFDFLVPASRTVDRLASLNVALTSVVEQATKLGLLGWQVNWDQNVQWALRFSRFGLSGYFLVNAMRTSPGGQPYRHVWKQLVGRFFIAKQGQPEKSDRSNRFSFQTKLRTILARPVFRSPGHRYFRHRTA